MKIDANILIGRIQELARKYPEVVYEETVHVLDLIGARLEKDVVERTPRGVGAEGGLAGSIHADVVGSMAGSVQLTVGTPIKDYPEVVEYGRRPGTFPPVAPIALWAERILGVGEQDAKSVGFAIARKIFVKGTEGAHMFEKAWDANERWAMDQLQTIPKRVIGRL